VQFNTFKISNFKAFGSKPQAIKEKPITLIYGKNSIGKSSLMQGILLFDYYKTLQLPKKNYFFLENSSYFAGDPIYFGKFENYVHQKNVDNEVIFKKTIIDKSEMLKIFFKDDEIFHYFIKEGLFDYIQEQVKNDDDSLKELFASAIKFIDYKSSFKDIDKKGVKNINDIKKIYVLNNECDPKTELLIQYICYNSIKGTQKIHRTIKLHLYLLSISKLEYSLQCNVNEKNNSIVDIRINDEDFLSIADRSPKGYFGLKQLTYKYEVKFNKQAPLANLFTSTKFEFSFGKFKLSLSYNYLVNPNSIRNIEDLAIFFWSRLYNIHYQEKTCQFIGPLRSIPNKKEIIFKKQSINMNNKIFDYETLIKYFNSKNPQSTINILDIRDIFQIFNFKSKPIFFTLMIIVILVAIILGILFLPLLLIVFSYKSRYLQPEYITILNKFLPSKLKISLYGAKTNEKIWRTLFENDETREKVNQWLLDNKNYTPYKISFVKVVKGFLDKILRKPERWQLVFNDFRNNTIVTPKDMGAGISQFLPLLISCIANKDTKLFIEQPELHLHPSMQGDLADEFIRSYNSNNNSLMAETHSEHILLRIMRRLRETSEGTLKDDSLKLTPNDVALLYIDADEERGTFITELELSEDGTLLDPWPGGFFEDGFKERFF